MFGNSIIPEKINNYNVYLNGTAMIGTTDSIDLPEPSTKTGTVSGGGVGGEIDSPTPGQYESMEQKIDFRLLYSSAIDLLKAGDTIDLTFRAAAQGLSRSGGYTYKGIRIVERGFVKSIALGKFEKGESMDSSVTLELTYLLAEVDGETLIEIDKLNEVDIRGGVDMLEEIRALI